MKPVASLSLDLDNEWSYLKTHGNQAWEEYPSYLPRVVPRILDFLDKRELKITFFVVGRDATRPENADPLREIADRGHEIGCHSFQHDPWLHLYSSQQLEDDLARAEEAIARVTGARVGGFRGPGFSLSPQTLAVLRKRGYSYDATVFPNLLNPLARAYFFAKSGLSKEERRQRAGLFGTWRDALRPVKPFRWTGEGDGLLEIPVTTMPVFKVPIHLSYVVYLAQYSRWLARTYFRFALTMCRVTGTTPSILLHPLDFMGPDDAPRLAFFPAMSMPLETKLEIVGDVLGALVNGFSVITIGEQAAQLSEQVDLPLLQPADL